MARVSLAATEDPPELRRRLESLQQDFDTFRQDAETAERDLEVELKFTREQLEEVNIDNEELKAQFQFLDVSKVTLMLLNHLFQLFTILGKEQGTRQGN